MFPNALFWNLIILIGENPHSRTEKDKERPLCNGIWLFPVQQTSISDNGEIVNIDTYIESGRGKVMYAGILKSLRTLKKKKKKKKKVVSKIKEKIIIIISIIRNNRK